MNTWDFTSSLPPYYRTQKPETVFGSPLDDAVWEKIRDWETEFLVDWLERLCVYRRFDCEAQWDAYRSTKTLRDAKR